MKTSPKNFLTALTVATMNLYALSASASSPPPEDPMDIEMARRGFRPVTQCEVRPFAADAQVWLPQLYIDPRARGVFIPAFSQGVIHMNEQLKSIAPRAWPSSSNIYAIIPETNYTASVPLNGVTMSLPDFALNALGRGDVPQNAPANRILPRHFSIQLDSLYQTFLSKTGATEINNNQCEKMLTSAERLARGYVKGTAFAPRARFDQMAGGNAATKYYVTSKDLYAVTDLFFLGGSEGLVNLEGNRSVMFGHTQSESAATHVFGCNVCRKFYVKRFGGGPLIPR